MHVMLATGFFPGEKMGGAEYQTMLMAKGLVSLGHQVTFLGIKSGKNRVYDVDGVAVWEIPGWPEIGWDGHRQQIAQILDERKPDLVYVRLLTELANVYALCEARGIAVVSVACSLKETGPLLLGYDLRQAIGSLRAGLTIPHFRSFMTIRKSAQHVTNLKGLTEKTHRWFPNLSIKTIYNGSPLPPADEIHRRSSGQVIWVNNLKRWKRPEIYVDLARRLPHYRFVMIGGSVGGRYGRQLDEYIAAGPSNLNYLGKRPIDDVNKMIGESDLLLYTSLPAEGFGNSFLQAWFRAVPTISYTFDLDGILERERVGRCAETFDELVDAVDALMSDESRRLAMGARARQYALENHTAEKMVADYEKLFLNVLNASEPMVATST